MTPPRYLPPLYLTCTRCGATMIRTNVRGLLIGNGTAQTVGEYGQCCTVCGHVHEAGAVMTFSMRIVTSEEVGTGATR